MGLVGDKCLVSNIFYYYITFDLPFHIRIFPERSNKVQTYTQVLGKGQVPIIKKEI